jgi:hypothetical protein
MLTGGLHELALKRTASPKKSTATQDDAVAHDTE